VLIGWLYRSALKRGATGGHWAWYVVALGALVLRRDQARRSQAPLTAPLKPGETLVITAREDVVTRRGRRRR
jgi:hypothetical protein